ncbi:integrase arm-type DNA-binding domain-containing protein [Geomonas sp. RF6]|uniref:tyrosine-type recombinase/integrase n=1 Tax=Geomonas sp. RF6 TaxID=2897342 RepID=UPI001E4D7768|nr:integrase arm-type DNA-binding domain-containing protein [Geomonas sp. RF6]UFS72676.1 integrase arm-type DNA-binding domain-containing protein [Geomonas sp. RF6]
MPKRIQPLSDSQVESATPRDRDYKLSDGQGLHLLVTKSGGKLWRFQYRFDRKQKLLALGAYPAVPLEQARVLRDQAKEHLAHHVDPGSVKKAEKAAKAQTPLNTFEMVAREWYEKNQSRWSDAPDLLSRLEKDVFPFIGNHQISEITASEVLAVLRRIELRCLNMAHRIRTACDGIFCYAFATKRALFNPVNDLRGALQSKYKKKTRWESVPPAEPKEVQAVLRLIDGYEGSRIVKYALQFAFLVLALPVELRHAKWIDIDFETKRWHVQPERANEGISRIVPLSNQAMAILRNVRPLTEKSEYVFSSARSHTRCISNSAVSAALRVMGFEEELIFGERFRSMARTVLQDIFKVSPHIIAQQLEEKTSRSHKQGYDQAEDLALRHGMMQMWANYLDALRTGAERHAQEDMTA